MVIVSYNSARVSSFQSFFDDNVELFDTFEGEFVFFDEDANGVAHEILGHFKDVRWHSCGKKNDLGYGGERLRDIVNLIFKTTATCQSCSRGREVRKAFRLPRRGQTF